MANILIFGDSIVQGDYDNEGGWADRIKIYCIQKTLNSDFKKYFEVYNLGKSGDTSEHLLKRIANELEVRYWEDPVTVIVIAIGIDDSAYFTDKKDNFISVSNYSKNLNKISQIAKKYTNKITFIGLTPVDEENMHPNNWQPHISYTNDFVRKYEDVLKLFCKENDIDFINVLKKFKENNYSKLIADGLHPNTKGHELIYKEVKKYLEEKKYI